jgi:hypothetical protein
MLNILCSERTANELITRPIVQIKSQMPQSISRVLATMQLLLNLGNPRRRAQFNDMVVSFNHVTGASVIIGDPKRLNAAKNQTLGWMLTITDQNLNISAAKLSHSIFRPTGRTPRHLPKFRHSVCEVV